MKYDIFGVGINKKVKIKQNQDLPYSNIKCNNMFIKIKNKCYNL